MEIPDATPLHERPTGSTHVPLGQALRVWAYVAINSFGGPAGPIAVMHRVLVDTHHWISERRFLHALNYCMLLPGPEAQQLSVYIGWLMHGVGGGLLAGTLFVLPGFPSSSWHSASCTSRTRTRRSSKRSSTGSLRRSWRSWRRPSSVSAGGRSPIGP